VTYKGTVSRGTVILPPDANLPDGTSVRIEPIEEPLPFESVFKKLSVLDGAIKDLPEDFAANHDHYIHGTPRPKPR
jgi:hypothetical protein